MAAFTGMNNQFTPENYEAAIWQAEGQHYILSLEVSDWHIKAFNGTHLS